MLIPGTECEGQTMTAADECQFDLADLLRACQTSIRSDAVKQT